VLSLSVMSDETTPYIYGYFLTDIYTDNQTLADKVDGYGVKPRESGSYVVLAARPVLN
jgi:hypothetical protein